MANPCGNPTCKLCSVNEKLREEAAKKQWSESEPKVAVTFSDWRDQTSKSLFDNATFTSPFPTTTTKEDNGVPTNPAEVLKKGLAAETPEDVHKCAVWLASQDVNTLVTLASMLAKRKIQTQEQLAEVQAKLEQIGQPPLGIANFIREITSGSVELEGCNGSSINPVEHLNSPYGEMQPGDRVLLTDGGLVVGFHSKPKLTGCKQGVVVEVQKEHAILEAPGESDKVIAALRGDVKMDVGDEVLYTEKPYVVAAVFEHKKEQKWAVEQPEKIPWSQIGGMNTIIKRIRQDLDIHLLHRAKVKKFEIRPMTGITLHGAPGVGKTMTAKAIAYYLSQKHKGTTFLNVAPGSLRGWLYGQTEHRIRELFEAAKKAKGYCIIFFDELDNFGTRSDSMESGIDSRVLATLLSELDGMGSEKEKILVIGATNRLDLCDQALVRPGRFGDRVYEVPRPDADAARLILKKYLSPKLPMKGVDQGVLIETVCERLYDPKHKALALHTNKQQRFEVGPEALVSGAMLESICQTIKHTAAHRYLEKGGTPGIEMMDADDAAKDALRQECQKLTKPHAAQHALGEPDGQQIVSVEIL